MNSFQQERQILSEKYGFDFPEDFFLFKKFMDELARNGLSLQASPLEIYPGPVFSVFDANPAKEVFDPLLESRYYYDPPEFFTILNGNTDGLHWGYIVDNTETPQHAVASYYHSSAYSFSMDGSDLFVTLSHYIQSTRDSINEYRESDSDNRAFYDEQLLVLNRIEPIANNYRNKAPKDAIREPDVETRSGLGICVHSAFYRETEELTKLLKKQNFTTANIQRLIQIAKTCLNEGFPGTALRIGEELWTERSCFDDVYAILNNAYAQLKRPALQRALQSAKIFREAADKR